MTMHIKDRERLFMNFEKTMALTTFSNIELKDYKQYSWDEFKLIYHAQLLDKKPEFVFALLKKAKKILEGFDVELHECEYFYNREEPLIILATEIGITILIAPKLVEA